MNEKIKKHVDDHKLLYVAGACICVGLIVGRSMGNEAPVVNNTAIASPVVNTTTTVANGGYSRKLVECLETGEIWKSVKDAAKAAGVEPYTMSKHLNGAKDHVNNLHYSIAGLSTN